MAHILFIDTIRLCTIFDIGRSDLQIPENYNKIYKKASVSFLAHNRATVTTYEYDNSLLSKKQTKSTDSLGENSFTEYSYDAFDNNGNWIEQTVMTKKNDSDTAYHKQRRYISYY